MDQRVKEIEIMLEEDWYSISQDWIDRIEYLLSKVKQLEEGGEMKTIICELCTKNVLQGVVYRMRNGFCICEDCKKELQNAERIEFDGRGKILEDEKSEEYRTSHLEGKFPGRRMGD